MRYYYRNWTSKFSVFNVRQSADNSTNGVPKYVLVAVILPVYLKMITNKRGKWDYSFNFLSVIHLIFLSRKMTWKVSKWMKLNKC